MNQMKVQIDELIAKKLCGESVPEDEKALQEWIDSDPANKAQYESIARQWSEVDNLLNDTAFDADAAWARVAAQTVNKPGRRKSTTIPLLRRSAAMAAVLLVAVIVYRMLAPGQTVVMLAEGGNKEMVLPDNTHVTLHAGSRLSYRKDLAGKERRVALEGEAYFKVQRDEQHPFVIDAQAGQVQVLGTAFDLKCSEDMAAVTVVEGKVRFSSAKDKNNFVILTRNQKAQLAGNEIKRSLVEDENFLYWKTGVLAYSNRELALIARQLSELFETKVELDATLTDEQKKQLVTVSFAGQSLEEMLTEICLVSRCRWTKPADKVYRISGT